MKITKVYNQILYPKYCYACPHWQIGKFFRDVPECALCEQLAQYGIYKTPAGTMYAFKGYRPFRVTKDK